jgi:thiol-disulfide isomerase/thioredoxin
MSFKNRAILLLIAAGFSACQQKSGGLTPAGCFRVHTFTDLNNRPANLSAHPERHGDVFYFLSPDCPLCQGYVPLLKKMNEQYGPRQFAFYAVFPGTLYSKQEVASFLDTYQLNSLSVVCDTALLLTRCLDATITPEVIVTDTSGQLIYKGRIDDQAWEIGQKKGLASTHELEEVLALMAAGKNPAFRQTEAAGCIIENK